MATGKYRLEGAPCPPTSSACSSSPSGDVTVGHPATAAVTGRRNSLSKLSSRAVSSRRSGLRGGALQAASGARRTTAFRRVSTSATKIGRTAHCAGTLDDSRQASSPVSTGRHTREIFASACCAIIRLRVTCRATTGRDLRRVYLSALAPLMSSNGDRFGGERPDPLDPAFARRRRRSACRPGPGTSQRGRERPLGLTSDGISLRPLARHAAPRGPVESKPTWAGFRRGNGTRTSTRFGCSSTKPFRRGGRPVSDARGDVARRSREEGTPRAQRLRAASRSAAGARPRLSRHPENQSVRGALHDGSLTRDGYFQQLLARLPANSSCSPRKNAGSSTLRARTPRPGRYEAGTACAGYASAR